MDVGAPARLPLHDGEGEIPFDAIVFAEAVRLPIISHWRAGACVRFRAEVLRQDDLSIVNVDDFPRRRLRGPHEEHRSTRETGCRDGLHYDVGDLVTQNNEVFSRLVYVCMM